MMNRRKFLGVAAAAIAAAGVREPDADGANLPGAAAGGAWLPRGAIYLPARSYNAYQTWRDYDPQIARRDAQFAASLGLNAFRLWLSFEFWRENRERLQQSFDDLLAACAARGIRVMPALFEGVGVEPAAANLADTNPFEASAVLSPSSEIVRDRKRWGGPRDYVDWFMDHFRNDQRLAAIEVQNEPHTLKREIFARAMIEQAAARRGSVPLTLGGITLKQSLMFLDAGLDVLQTHMNFPPSAEYARKFIESQTVDAEKVVRRPVWLTEWQRIRPSGTGWGSKPLVGNEWQPDYASLAPIVRSYAIGNFFWSLMLKPAYLLAQRQKGTLSGIFHEDGAVWSLADARAVSGNKNFEAEERQSWPEWAKMIPEKLGLS